MCQVRNLIFEDPSIFFALSFGQGVYVFEESPISIQDFIRDVCCPGKYCFEREKCVSVDGYVTTPRSFYGCGNCGAWLFVHKIPFMLQEHVKAIKTDKTRSFLLKKMNLLPVKLLFNNDPFQSTKNAMKELCVDNKIQETIVAAFCPASRNEKCVYISTKKTSSFHDCKKCNACCHFLNAPFTDHKVTFLLFGGDGTHCFARKTNHDYEKQKTFSNFAEIFPPITIKHTQT